VGILSYTKKITVSIPLTTAYQLRSYDTDSLLTGDLLTETSERTVKKLISQLLDKTAEYTQTMPTTVQESAIMICYRESLSNLEKFNGGEGQTVLQFTNSIERIGKIIDASDNLLHCMCTAKLDGEAKRWYENNTSLAQWGTLKSALSERFTTSDPSSKIFEQLKERKQKPDETIASYYDAMIKLCHEYDPGMSQKMMISWLENGVKDSLKLQIKRQMKALPETARTTQAFLKIAKDEQELQETVIPTSETTAPYVPYFTNTVSTTLHETENTQPTTQKYSHLPTTAYQQRKKFNTQQRTTSQTHPSSSQQNSFTSKPNTSTPRRNTQYIKSQNYTPSNSLNANTRQFKPCAICKRNNHHTSNCYYKNPNGCYKCGQSDHHIRDCPQVFY
jgi:Retrotransposon gag protein/Zinc knuckle